jgi:hypothetical protein
MLRVCYGDNMNLFRAQPYRKLTGLMLYQEPDEALVAS